MPRSPADFEIDSSSSPLPVTNSLNDPAATAAPLIDRFDRIHDSLRLSVTDRCNLRCLYCMPESADDFEDAASLLSFDQIERVARVLAASGVNKIRITGGEPLLRRSLPELVERLAAIPCIDDLAITTNGIRLPALAEPLQKAGIRRVNISLDTLNEESFQRVTRRRGLDRVIAGIDAAVAAGFDEIRLNALAIRGLNEDQILPLARFAKERGLLLRFIEYMPLGGDRSWQSDQMLSGATVREWIQRELGPLVPLGRPHPSQPSIDFEYADGGERIGFINPVSDPFCGACNRLRLTAAGALRNCLFSHHEWQLAPLLAAGADDAMLLATIRECLEAKEAGHLITRPGFRQPDRPMYQIGG